MIISHKYRFIFIKTRKTAGTSIEVYLSSLCGEDDVVTPISPHVEPHRPRNYEGFSNHAPAVAARERLGPSDFESYFRFCVERNPWDKTLSYYHMRNHREGGGMGLDQYLDQDDFCLDHPAYTEPDDPTRLMVDRVVRYETLNEELAEVFGTLGIPFHGTLGVRAKSECRRDRRPYREVFTRDQARRVEAAFEREIRLFGYRF